MAEEIVELKQKVLTLEQIIEERGQAMIKYQNIIENYLMGAELQFEIDMNSEILQKEAFFNHES